MLKYFAVKDDVVVCFNSQKKFSEKYDLKQGAISKCINGKINKTGGWSFYVMPVDSGYDFEDMMELSINDITLTDILPLKNYMRVSEYSEFRGVTTQTVHNWIKAGKVRFSRITKKGLRILLTEAEINAVKERRKKMYE